jgi:hypothetical protein
MTDARESLSHFGANEHGLIQALRTLLRWHGAEAGPVPRGVTLELPATLPERGIGGEQALEALTPALAGGRA